MSDSCGLAVVVPSVPGWDWVVGKSEFDSIIWKVTATNIDARCYALGIHPQAAIDKVVTAIQQRARA